MKALVKCKIYFFTSLAAMLFMVGSAISNEQTGVSTGKTKPMAQKPTVMILGSTHLANPGNDGFNTKMDDVLAPKRQREIQQLVEQLKEFKPTKIALERDPSSDPETNTNYQNYLKGTYELKRGEGDQIGFRLAKLMGQSRLYGVDYWPKEHPILGKIDTDWHGFAKEHNQEHLVPTPPIPEGKIITDKDGTTWIEPEKYQSIIEMYIHDNEPEGIRTVHQLFQRTARIGLDDQYPGANWFAHFWYARNLKTFVNLTRIAESADDRILLIIGASHVHLIQQFLEDSGDYIIESPLKYLKAEDTN